MRAAEADLGGFLQARGRVHQHEGDANLAHGDAKIADLVGRLQSSPQWNNMVIMITYDEFGGVRDHAGPPKADLLGPGTRIPALIISPLANKGTPITPSTLRRRCCG
jgi:phospholipase C